MTDRNYPEIAPEVLARKKRRIILAGGFTVFIAVGDYLWASAQTTKGIQIRDILAAIVLGLGVIGAVYAGWRIGIRRLSEQYRSKVE
jgi:hypothetical protein